MAVILRPFSETDYLTFTKLYNRCRPVVAQTEVALRAFDEAYKGDVLLNLVAEAEGELVGAVWAHIDGSGERQVRLDMVAHPDVAGLSGTLYKTAWERLEPHQPTALVVRVREDWPYWVDFYHLREFGEQERMWESRLELAAFDAEPFAGALERVSSAGVTLITLANLPDGEATQRLLYGTVVKLLGDVPFSEPLNIWPFTVWQGRFWQRSARRPEGFFLAFHGAELVGVSELREGPRPD